MSSLRYLVVDNFYPDPWAVQHYATQLPYEDASTQREKQYYKGLLSPTNHAYARLGAMLLGEAVGRPISTRFAVGEFRVLLKRESATEMERTWVHNDSSAARYSAIVYLNRPEHCSGGTSFYRHRATGLYHLPDEGSPLADQVMKQQELGRDQLIARLARDGFEVEEEWDLVTHVPMDFNRCLIFDSRLFHARTGTFGTSVETGRLTQNFFFD